MDGLEIDHLHWLNEAEEEIVRLNGLLAEECRVAHVRRTGPHTYFWNVSEQRWQGVDERNYAPN